MNKQDLLVLFGYNAWSNAKILDAASHISHEEFLAPVAFPHGSLRGTLVHALFAEWIWLNRWNGIPQSRQWIADEFPTFTALQARWAEEDARLMQFARDLTDAQLYSKFQYISTEGYPYERVVWEAAAHLVNHGTQHKTEAAAILTGVGHSPGDIDLIVYLNEAR